MVEESYTHDKLLLKKEDSFRQQLELSVSELGLI